MIAVGCDVSCDRQYGHDYPDFHDTLDQALRMESCVRFYAADVVLVDAQPGSANNPVAVGTDWMRGSVRRHQRLAPSACFLAAVFKPDKGA